MSYRKPVTKKIINSPETCVDDNLRGVVAAYPALRLHPKHRVVTVRSDGDSGRVAILSGGGSGHEPFTVGEVGAGMLDGAVAGGVFASPPTSHILYAIKYLYKYNSGGVLVMFGNYTGDRLTFGKAVEKAKNAGIKVDVFIDGEDVASSNNKLGGRSMCGSVFITKICGSMAARGYDLQKIQEMAAESNKHTATLGVTLSACSLPGQPPLFEIADDEMELGAGVHGEAGISKMKLRTAKETVQIILDQVIAHLKLSAGDRVAVLINNLGGTSLLEMNIVNAETKDYLESKKIVVERLYSGHVKTSLEMQGFQICLFHLIKQYRDLWLELLDTPTSALGWTGSELSVPRPGGHGDDDDESLLQSDGTKTASGPVLSIKEQDLLRGSLQVAAEDLVKNEELLNKLDSGCGDGDCGNTLKKFAQVILKYSKTASVEYPSNVLWDLSEIAETDMGGTSGGIYSLGLSAASQALANATANNVTAWLSAWEHAMQSITKYGGAEPGDRTMLDTLHTAAETFKKHLNGGLKEILKKTAEASEQGARATAQMTARAGRASYVASGYTQDEDAGARATAIWLQAILNYIANKC